MGESDGRTDLPSRFLNNNDQLINKFRCNFAHIKTNGPLVIFNLMTYQKNSKRNSTRVKGKTDDEKSEK